MTHWSNNAVLTFLEAYKGEPALWDPTSDVYKDRVEVHEIWRKLSQRLKLSVGELKRKKESLMATYRYYTRKKRLSQKSAAGAEAVYKPTWYAFNYMDQFLNKVYKGADTLDNTRSEIEYSEFYIQSSPIEEEKEAPNADAPNRSDQKKTTRKRKRRRRPTPVRHEFASAPGVEDSSLGTPNVTTEKAREESDDDCELYGKLLAIKLRRLPEWQRQIVMYELDGILLNKINQYRTSSHNSSYRSSTRVVKSPVEIEEELISE